ncbi:hypothetical protein IWX46DRAFT_587722 [Phyllosticta citricarpa]|uniref:Uncharacterized protein n=1 Tax=Phyllosticta citricarpa TaxID=55181 RepID=A0ABR1MPJ9_9PEZI
MYRKRLAFLLLNPLGRLIAHHRNSQMFRKHALRKVRQRPPFIMRIHLRDSSRPGAASPPAISRLEVTASRKIVADGAFTLDCF